jgi:hypothetical protein
MNHHTRELSYYEILHRTSVTDEMLDPRRKIKDETGGKEY